VTQSVPAQEDGIWGVGPRGRAGGMLFAVVINPLKERVKYNTVKIFSGYDLIRGEVRSPDHSPLVASLRIVAGRVTLLVACARR
jgi:hypothetical protein